MDQRVTNYYDDLFARLIGDGVAQRIAVERIATAYLDGKPVRTGKKKATKKERDSLFWASDVVKSCQPDVWGGEAMLLALVRYFGQEFVTTDGLVTRIARETPEVLVHAVRRSGLVLKSHSPRRIELDQAAIENEAVAELCRMLDLFAQAHHERVAVLDAQKAQLAGLSVFDLLLYASLYAFEVLVPRDFDVKASALPSGVDVQVAWDALSDLLAWKLAGTSSSSLKLTDDGIGRSLARHLRPVLFESGTAGAGEALRNLHAFHALMDAQIELNEFISRSADAFSYDDGVRFERRGDRLEIVEVDPAAREAWQRDGLKLGRLHGYWFHRAVDTYVEQVAADQAAWMIGRAENAEANRLAWLRALQAQLRLREAYGVADTVTSDAGDTVDLFRALLSLDLMSAFFLRDFLAAFAERVDASGDWIVALQRLAMDGLRDGLQNRLPLTWSGRDSKVSKITGWTVTKSQPGGDPRMASAILDFWTHDMVATAERLQRNEPGLHPHLFERPVLKFGATLVQLPWVVGVQNNSTAAINNLRRLGARRGQARDEAQRIEAGIARLLEERGFRTLLNWAPPRNAEDAGEVDLIATFDGHLFIIEVKSTFMRRSQRDAWLHATTALRKAGQQLRRKAEAVLLAISSDVGFRTQLGWAEGLIPTRQHVWIADTCIECDHQRFGGFLKISIEELLIALRDDRHLLNDPGRPPAGNGGVSEVPEVDADAPGASLYPEGFNAERFVEVIETEAVWDVYPAQPSKALQTSG
ncbi:MAG TPA: hypothetical protein PKE27_01240 [Povalibacter sp.]|uniref:hypothetical protein n=1 Tax=Povalibacter sp. TaxID=1962978 RepID=UPI002C33F729|nr:hypothetical protein [Povalibacter sp.]HMN43173.1 hypothetical protein [Povalibacter sp.]